MPTPTTIDWTPQVMSKHGDFIAERFLSLLNTGSEEFGLSEPELLVRETAQNTWDARRAGGPSMDFRIVDVESANRLHESIGEFFGSFTRDSGARRLGIGCLDRLSEALRADSLALLYVRDVGTHGLGGPTDASVEVREPGTDRYVKFLLNVGDANTDTSAGGAYGLGRSVFWRLSTCSTVIVYSRCATASGVESRLVGLSLGDKFVRNRRNHTGRHWWNEGQEGQPLTGSRADAWATALGFEPYPDDTTGTTVLVIAPYAPQGTKDLALALARSIEYHLWPKYVKVPGRRTAEAMSFAVHLNGAPVEVRDRDALHRTHLRHFIDALVDVLGAQKEPSNVEDKDTGPARLCRLEYAFRTKEFPKDLGILAARVFVDGDPVGAHRDNPDEEERGLASTIEDKITELRNSIALMRTPELVVTYQKFQFALAEPGISFAGVFKSSKNANEYFRRAESATHSEWDGKYAPRGEGVISKKFHETLRSRIERWFAVPPTVRPLVGGDRLAVERVAEDLGRWFTDWQPGEGGFPIVDDEDDDGGDGNGGNGGKKPRASLTIDTFTIGDLHGSTTNTWTLTAGADSGFELELEIREADEDGRSTREVAVAPGARPAIFLVGADCEFVLLPDRRSGTRADDGRFEARFDVGEDVQNRTTCRLAFGTKKARVTVEAVVEGGTVPVLGADITVSTIGVIDS